MFCLFLSVTSLHKYFGLNVPGKNKCCWSLLYMPTVFSALIADGGEGGWMEFPETYSMLVPVWPCSICLVISTEFS